MKSRIAIVCTQMLLAFAAKAVEPAAPTGRLHVFHHENVLGTSLELKVVTASPAQAAQAEAAALAEIDRLAKILSSYDPASEFSRWLKTAQQPIRVSPELFEVLSLFDLWRVRTDGALDASAETICQLWKSAATRQQVPSLDDLAAALGRVRQPHWKLDAAALAATHLSDAPLVLNSFAKIYIASRAGDAALAVTGAGAVVVNIGGDLVVRGELTEPVLIADPRSDAENGDPIARLQVRNRAVATSGRYRRGLQIGHRWYSHIVDPRTGQPADHVISATVVAPDATDAGALATGFCVLSPAESLRLAASLPNVECLLITKDGERLASPGWSGLEVPRIQLASAGPLNGLLAGSAARPSAGETWDPAFELIVRLELSRIEGRRAARPFVAVWIEDKDKFPVRTLALWFDQPRWLPDLKAWFRADRLRALADGTEIINSVSSATRAPGKYSLKWDGRDDEGKLVKPGQYTVLIEAAREHGTYQLIHQEMEFAGAARQIDIKGNVEIASASLDYRRKTDAR